MLRRRQVDHRPADPGPVTRRAGRRPREHRGGLRAAAAAAGLRPVLDHPSFGSGRSNTCLRATPTTGASPSPAPKPPHTAGVCSTTSSGSVTWRQMRSRRAGLLARPPPPPLTWRRRLAARPVLRRRFRRVRRVRPQPPLQLGQPRRQPLVVRPQLPDHRVTRVQLHAQHTHQLQRLRQPGIQRVPLGGKIGHTPELHPCHYPSTPAHPPQTEQLLQRQVGTSWWPCSALFREAHGPSRLALQDQARPWCWAVSGPSEVGRRRQAPEGAGRWQAMSHERSRWSTRVSQLWICSG